MSPHFETARRSAQELVNGVDQISTSAFVNAIEDAKERLGEHVIRTPTIRLPWLDKCGVEVWAKLECQQHSGSFKYRGAINALLKTDSQSIVTASAGNHALATAAAGKRLSKQVHVIAPTTATDIKVRRLAEGADVTLLGQDLFEATKEALALEKASKGDVNGGLYYLSPYDNLDVAAGAGTVVTEAFEDQGPFDHVIVPLGGGGLAAAVGAWCAQHSPSTKVQCTHPSVFGREFDSSNASFISQELHRSTALSYSDGLAVQLVQHTPFANILDSTIHSVVQVSEPDTAAAIAKALRMQSLLIEGSAATAIAGLTNSIRDCSVLGRVLLLLTGGNISSNAVARALVTDLSDVQIRQEVGLRHIISSVERHGSVRMRQNNGVEVANGSMSTASFWTRLALHLQEDIDRLRVKYDRKQLLASSLSLQSCSWSYSVFHNVQQQLQELCDDFLKELKTCTYQVSENWKFEERFRLMLQLYGMLFSLHDRTSSANDQSKRDWFFEVDMQHPNICNYDRYGSSELRRVEQRFLGVLSLGHQQPIDLLLTSSGMAAYQVIQHFLLQQFGSQGNIVMSPYVYFEALEQIQELRHIKLIHAQSFDADDIIETAEKHNAQAVFLDPVANTVELATTDIRYFAITVSSRPGWENRIVVIDGTMESGAMPIYDWLQGPHMPTLLYYESASKYLQLGLDLQMGGVLVYPSHLDQTMRTIRRNAGSIMYSRNVALLPPVDFSLYSYRMSQLTANAESLSDMLESELESTVEVRYPHVWRAYGWRHGGAIITLRFLQKGMNNKEGLEACIELILRLAEDVDLPITKGVSFGFSTTRVSSASSMAVGIDPFLRFSVGWDIEHMEKLASIIIRGVRGYQAVFEGENDTTQIEPATKGFS